MRISTTARAIKVAIVLDAAALAGVVVPPGDGVTIAVQVAGRTLKAVLNPKSVRRISATVSDLGVENVVLVLQGKLDGESIVEAGLQASPKTPKVTTAEQKSLVS